MIAATAIVHNLIVVTRNLRDFAPFGVRTVDPFVTALIVLTAPASHP